MAPEIMDAFHQDAGRIGKIECELDADSEILDILEKKVFS